jgi:hypothetical protein
VIFSKAMSMPRGFFLNEGPMFGAERRFLWNSFEKPPPAASGILLRPLIIQGLPCNHTQV